MGKRQADREAVKEGLSAVFGSGEDILGSVIRNDQRRGGREAAPEAAGQHPPPQLDVMTSTQVLGQTNTSAEPSEDKSQRPQPSPRRRKHVRGHEGTSVRAGPEAPLAERYAEAERLARTPTMTLTLRIPQGFNAWLDEYVHRAWPERVRKQELVVEALRMLLARRGGAGEPVLSTDLLPEEEP